MSSAKVVNNNARFDRFARVDVPWYKRGGMQTNLYGIGLNIFIPFFWWGYLMDADHRKTYYALWIASMLISAFGANMRTVYCVFLVPTYFATVLVPFWVLPRFNKYQYDGLSTGWIFILYLCVGVWKAGVGMSVCLHRYASHGAFACGPVTKWCLLIIGCMANQGGPLWWAATHRAHHRFCDTDQDPHSPKVDGIEKAFAFFFYKLRVLKDFVPRHLQVNEAMWYLDNWAFLVHTTELFLFYMFFGHVGLWVSYWSAWGCQMATMWFNIINHPVEPGYDRSKFTTEERNDMMKMCEASDNEFRGFLSMPPGTFMAGRFLPFHMFNFLNIAFGPLLNESAHQEHHDHPLWARRSKYDFFYWTFIFPLEALGLVWNVQKYTPVKTL